MATIRRLAAPILAVLCLATGVSHGQTPYSWLTGTSGNFNDPTKWDSGGGPPGTVAGDSATISPGSASPFTVTLTVNPANPLLNFTLDDANATFTGTGRTMTITGTAALDNGLVTGSISWAGSGTLNNNATITQNAGVAYSIDTFNNAGTLTTVGITTISSTVFSNSGTVNVLAGAGAATLTISNGFTNAGNINLTGGAAGATLNVTTGTLVNAASGAITFDAGSGARQLGANLTNNGAVNVNKDTTFSKASGAYINNGNFTIASGSTLTISGSSQVFTQNAGTLTNNGSFNLSSATFNYDGGAIAGNNLSLQNSTLNFGAGGTGAATFDLTGATAFAGNVSNGQTLNVIATASVSTLTSVSGFTNAGNINLTGGAATSTVAVTTGTLINAATGVLTFDVGTGARTLNSSLTNNGTVNVDRSTSFIRVGGAYVNNSAFNIASGSTLTISGSSQVFTQNAGTLTNNGSFNLSSATFNYDGGAIAGNNLSLQNSTLNFGAGGTGAATFDLTGATAFAGNVSNGQTLNVIATASVGSLTSVSGFTNAGNINLTGGAATSTVVVTTGTLINAATGVLTFDVGTGARTLNSSLTNNGTVNVDRSTSFIRVGGAYVNNSTFNIASGSTLTISGSSQVFTQNAGTLTNNGSFNLSSATFNYDGGAIAGNNLSLQNSTLNFGAGGTGAATFDLTGATAFAGNVSNGQTLNVIATASVSTLTSVSGFTNAGNINLTGGAATSTVAVTTGTLINAATGVLTFDVGTGSRTLTADLTNNGTVNMNRSTTFNKTSGAYVNNSTFNIASGATLTISGLSQVFTQAAGTLTNNGAMSFSSVTLNLSGGSIAGNLVGMSGGTLNIPVLSTATGGVDWTGTGTLNGDIKTGQTVQIRSLATATNVTSAGSFSNSGTIILTGGLNSSTLTLTAGTLTNNAGGVITIDPTGGGARNIAAHLLNNGVFNVNDGVTVARIGAAHANAGQVHIAAGETLTFTGASFTNQAGGTIDGTGVLAVAALTGGGFVVNNGTFSPGASAGVLSVTGGYNQSAAGELFIEIGGTTVGTQYDRLAVSAIANLDGVLTVDLISGFVPTPLDTFTILTAGTRNGFFSNALTTVAVLDGGTFDVTYTATSVILSNFTVIPEPAEILGFLLVCAFIYFSWNARRPARRDFRRRLSSNG